MEELIFIDSEGCPKLREQLAGVWCMSRTEGGGESDAKGGGKDSRPSKQGPQPEGLRPRLLRALEATAGGWKGAWAAHTRP